MNNPDRYIYQAVFKRTDEAVEVRFPDLSGLNTFGADMDEALDMAKDALEQYLLANEELGLEIPEPSAIGNLDLSKDEIVFVIDVWMPLLRDQESNRAIKKTLTIPKWLNDLAVKKGINFSQVLQAGLKNTIGIT